MGGAPGPLDSVSPAVLFTRAARELGAAARAAGLEVPAFRSPPRLEGAIRTVRQFPGGAVVSVAVRGRAFEDVAVDLVEGIVRINGLEGDAAAAARHELLDVVRVAPEAEGLASPGARMAQRQTQAA